MKKTVLLSVITSMVVATLPSVAYAEHVPVIDDIVIYDYTPELYTLPEIEEASLLAIPESEMEVVTISTADELIAVRDKVNSDLDYSKDKIFKLTNSIDLGGIEWEPIGYNRNYRTGDNLIMLSDYAFRGIFDGQGNTVSNFKMTDEDLGYLGFFGTVQLGTVRNLNIADASINYNGNTSIEIPKFSGILTAFCNYATISNCNIDGDIKIVNDDVFVTNTIVSAGMLCGSGLANINNCTATGSINVNALCSPIVGGLWGYSSTTDAAFYSAITECYSDVSINVESISGISAGGIIGHASTSISAISDCSYSDNSDITISHYYSVENLVAMTPLLGGIAGVNNSNIVNCTVGDIAITADSEAAPVIGGIAGKNEATVDNCLSLADIYITLTRSSLRSASTPTAGGITGMNGALHDITSDPAHAERIPVVKNCTIPSEVSITINSDSASSSACGFINGISYAPSEIENCASYSSDMNVISANAGTYAGGISGFLNGAKAKYCNAVGSIGENISSATATYIGGITGVANLKYFYVYDTSFGITSPLFTVPKFYGGVIEDCKSQVDITPTKSSRIYAGGICGYLTNVYTEDSLNYYIKANRELAISGCASASDITVTPNLDTYAGGVVGYSIDGKIYDSYSTGSVTLTKDASSTYIGGFIGGIYQNKHDYEDVTASIDNCYTTGELVLPQKTSKAMSGAFVANVIQSPVTRISPRLTSCYYLGEATETLRDGLLAITSDELANADSFANWDFDSTWIITDNGPVLRYENTAIYRYETDGTEITSILISKPQNNSKLFAVTYAGDEIIDVDVYNITDKNYINEYFITLPCSIEIADNVKLYYWGGEDCMQPLWNVFTSEDLI